MSNRSDCFQTTDIVNNKLVEFPKEIADAINAGIQVNESTSPPAVESPTSHERAQSPVEGRKENQDTITGWANATFGPADSNIRIAARANEEMAELLRALSADDDNPKAAEEIADVVIVLYRVASRLGYDLHRMIDKKMEINRGREWKLDNTGHGYHVRNKSVTPTETPTATPSAAVGADEPGAGDEKEWCDGAKEFCERQVESETVPRAEYDRVVKLNHHLREVAVMAIVERVPSDSKPTNVHNPESEDTPQHNPVMGPVVGTATVKHQTSCPAATAPTVPPEVGKRYVCGNGEVTDAMTLDGGPAYPFMARTDHVLRSWRGDGRHDESKISEYDLIDEYHEPEPSPPAESDVDRLQRELDAAVEYHDNYTSKIDKALGQPRHGGDLLTGHLKEIERLKALSATTSQPAESPVPDKHRYAIGDTVRGSVLWGDGSIMDCKIVNLDAGISREAFIVDMPDGRAAVMLLQSILDPLQKEPAESPDDWVMITDPNHVLRSCDEVRYAEGSWHPCRASVGAKRGTQTWEEFRCRRKDLPVVPVESTALPQFPEGADNNTVLWVQAAAWTTIFKWCYDNGMPIGRGLNALQTLAQWILDLKASAKPQNHNAAPADKPRMRQVTLREYRHTDESTAWSSSGWLVESRLTGRTCVTEVPE